MKSVLTIQTGIYGGLKKLATIAAPVVRLQDSAEKKL
jgi:hypothetical protein